MVENSCIGICIFLFLLLLVSWILSLHWANKYFKLKEMKGGNKNARRTNTNRRKTRRS